MDSKAKRRFDIARRLHEFWSAYHEAEIAKHQYKLKKSRLKYYKRIGTVCTCGKPSRNQNEVHNYRNGKPCYIK